MTDRCRGLTAAIFVGALLTVAMVQTEPVRTAAVASASCESLSTLALPNTTITAAQAVPAGVFTPPAPNRGGAGGRRGGVDPAAAPQDRAPGRGAEDPDAAQSRGAGAGRGAATAQLYAALPSFCRVSATLTPSSDSDIKIEVWLPASGW